MRLKPGGCPSCRQRKVLCFCHWGQECNAARDCFRDVWENEGLKPGCGCTKALGGRSGTTKASYAVCEVGDALNVQASPS